MRYILFIFLWTNTGVTSDHFVFPNKTSCLAALKEIVEEVTLSHPDRELHCIPERKR